MFLVYFGSRDGVTVWRLDYILDNREMLVRHPAEQVFLFSEVSVPTLGYTQPLTGCVPGLFPRGEGRLEDEADYSPPYTIMVCTGAGA